MFEVVFVYFLQIQNYIMNLELLNTGESLNNAGVSQNNSI